MANFHKLSFYEQDANHVALNFEDSLTGELDTIFEISRFGATVRKYDEEGEFLGLQPLTNEEFYNELVKLLYALEERDA